MYIRGFLTVQRRHEFVFLKHHLAFHLEVIGDIMEWRVDAARVHFPHEHAKRPLEEEADTCFFT